MTATHRMIARTNPTAAQVKAVDDLLLAALAMKVVGRGATFDTVHAELLDAVKGRPVRATTARMVADMLRLAGCDADVVEVTP